MSEPVSRRNFIKGVTAVVGGLIATVIGVPTIAYLIDPALREKNFGSWEGLTDTEIAARFPDAVHGTWGDGETTEEVAERAVAAIERIRGLHPESSVLVVSHGGALRAILGHLGVAHGPIRNCDVFRVVC